MCLSSQKSPKWNYMPPCFCRRSCTRSAMLMKRHQHLMFRTRRFRTNKAAFLWASMKDFQENYAPDFTCLWKRDKCLFIMYLLYIFLLVSTLPLLHKMMDVLLQSSPSACSQNNSDFTCATVYQKYENTDSVPFTEMPEFLTWGQFTAWC